VVVYGVGIDKAQDVIVVVVGGEEDKEKGGILAPRSAETILHFFPAHRN